MQPITGVHPTKNGPKATARAEAAQAKPNPPAAGGRLVVPAAAAATPAERREVKAGGSGARGPMPPAGGGAPSGHGGFMAALMVLMLAMFAFIYYLAYQAEDLSEVRGYPAASGSTVRNLKGLLAVGLSSGRNLTVTEEEINGYLAATLKLRQGGPLAGKARVRGVAVRLDDGEFQVVIERELFGRRHTAALHFTLAQTTQGEATIWNVHPAGGKVGKLPVAGGLLQLIMKPVFQIGSAYKNELRILQHASSVRVEKGRLLLGPVLVRQ